MLCLSHKLFRFFCVPTELASIRALDIFNMLDCSMDVLVSCLQCTPIVDWIGQSNPSHTYQGSYSQYHLFHTIRSKVN